MKYHKIIMCIILFVAFATLGKAQNNLDDQVEYMLDDLDKSSITTNILLERGFKLADPQVYDGTLLRWACALRQYYNV